MPAFRRKKLTPPTIVTKATAMARPRIRKLPGQARKGVKLARAAVVVTRAQQAMDAKDYDRAMTLLDALLAKAPGTKPALGLASQVLVKQGDFDRATMLAGRLAELSNRPEHRARARNLTGRLVETDPAFLPTVGRVTPPTQTLPNRVLYLAKESLPFHSNGYCTRSHETLKAVRSAGYDPIAVTQPGFPATVGIESAEAESVVEGIPYHHLLPGSANLSALPYDTYLQLSADLLAREVARSRPGMLHIGSGHRGYEYPLLGRALSAWAGLPWLYEVRSFFETTWTDDERYMESSSYFQRRFDAETAAMRAADLIVTLSGPMREEIINGHGVPADRVHVIPNAVDIERFTPEDRNPELRAKLGLDGLQVLGYISNLDHHREAQEVLLRATARLRERGVPAACLLVGTGRRKPELERLAGELGLGRYAVFTGSVPFAKVAQYYAQIDLFVVPRINERAGRLVSPMKPFEAMAMRVPVVVSDLPALVEISGGGHYAATFRAGEPDSLAAVAGELLAHPERMSAMAERAAAWVATDRTWAANGTAFATAYAAAAANYSARTGTPPAAAATELYDPVPTTVQASDAGTGR